MMSILKYLKVTCPLKFQSLAFVVASLVLATANALARPAAMPTVSAESLAGRILELPKQLPSAITVVMAGYEFDHQAQMDEWLQKLALRHREQEWLQLHLIGGGYRWLSGFINSRKRPYFPEEYVRSRVVPVYTQVDAFNQAMQWSGVKTIHIAIVNQDGQVLYSQSGAYSDDRGARFLEALSMLRK
jgi:hypothetical protein